MAVWFPVIAVGAAAALAAKAIAREWKAALGSEAIHDREGVRTVVRFVTHDLEAVLLEVAAEIAHLLGESRITLERDAVRRGSELDVMRLCDRGRHVYTLTLTRAYSGPRLSPAALALLRRVDDILRRDPRVSGVAWFARQDRELHHGFVAPHA